jgi:hypothetical protein
VVGEIRFAKANGGDDMAPADTTMDADPAVIAAAMDDITAAGRELTAVKKSGALGSVDRAQRELQSAVDAARELGAGWGQIGAALGIARGNAYQRFRKKAFGWPAR